LPTIDIVLERLEVNLKDPVRSGIGDSILSYDWLARLPFFNAIIQIIPDNPTVVAVCQSLTALFLISRKKTFLYIEAIFSLLLPLVWHTWFSGPFSYC
jgi:hypothetical protein